MLILFKRVADTTMCSNQLSLSRLDYRPDIDGLRAVAVMSVVLYHSGFQSLSGGFVGVDVFFVISGYLITKLLLTEINAKGSIDFYGFYIRRFRRILPALLFTLLASLLVAVIILTPQRLEAFGRSVIHAILSISNVFFFLESGYFDLDSSLKPLLHTWSLGVEEQFYFVWPFVVLFVAKKNDVNFYWFLGIGLVSLFSAAILITVDASAVFFLMPFRVFEFVIGAGVFLLEESRDKSFFNYLPVKNSLLLAGFGLIAFSVLNFSKNTQFPGLAAIVPCIGAALCIYAKDADFGCLLKNKLMVGIGLISYSLYLIHWPIIVFYKSFKNVQDFSLSESVVIVTISIVAAMLMYFFIEKPFRKAKKSNRNFLLALALSSFVLMLLGAWLSSSGASLLRPWIRNSSISVDDIKKGRELRFQVRQAQCVRKGWNSCDALADNRMNALIVGDSHAADALNAFDKLYPEHNFVMSSLGGCPPHRDIAKITAPNHPDLEECKRLNFFRYNEKYLKQFDYIVINVLFEWYTVDYLREYLRFLKDAGVHKVIVVGGYYSLSEELPELINKLSFNSGALKKFITTTSAIDSDPQLKGYTEEFGFLFLSKRDAFCKNGDCAIFDDNRIPFTYDKHHLSYEFSSRIALLENVRIAEYLIGKRNDQ